MTRIQNKPQFSNTPSSMPLTPTRRSPSSATSKLRDSCHACALSKIKCHKEKPTCSRCARRGITCEYFMTKRPGRKPNNSEPTTTSNNSSSSSRSSNRDLIDVETPGFAAATATSSTHDAALSASFNDAPLTPLGFNTPISISPRLGDNVSGSELFSSSSSADDTFSSLLMPLDPLLTGMSNEFNDFTTSPINFLELDGLRNSNFVQGHNDITKLLIPDNTDPAPVPETSFTNRPNIHAYKPASPSYSVQATSANHTYTSCCLMRALDLLSLTSTKSPTSPLINGSEDDATTASNNMGHSNYPSPQTVIMENQQIIEAVRNMLQCPCTKDSDLLAMLSMIVFQVLGRYSTAAQKQPAVVIQANGDVSTSEQSSRRMTSQLILNELHRVQRLVNQLSPRLKPARQLETAASKAGRVSSAFDSKKTRISFSPTTLDQMGLDLRQSLSTVSLEIINMLRQS